MDDFDQGQDDAVQVLNLADYTGEDDRDNLIDRKNEGWELIEIPYVKAIISKYDELIKPDIIDNAIALARAIDPDPDDEFVWNALHSTDFDVQKLPAVVSYLMRKIRFSVTPELEDILLNSDRDMSKEMVLIKAAIWRMALGYFGQRDYRFNEELDAVFDDLVVEQLLK